MVRMARCLLLLAGVVLLSGCVSDATVAMNFPHARSRTLTENSDEHHYKMTRVAEMDLRALVEDLDVVFLAERPTRLSRWHDR